MKIGLHLTLSIVGEFAAFGLGAGYSMVQFMKNNDELGAAGLLHFGLALLGPVLLVRVVFRCLLFARCPQPRCGGRSYARGSKPITYVCKSCGHVHETGVSEGGGDSPHFTRFDD
ncbi:MAG: hypothetical protein ACI8QC_000247 [Planctomycetota bacterium]|jgi:hypothetical protein